MSIYKCLYKYLLYILFYYINIDMEKSIPNPNSFLPKIFPHDQDGTRGFQTNKHCYKDFSAIYKGYRYLYIRVVEMQ